MTKSIFSKRYQCLKKILVDARNKAELSQTQLGNKLGKTQNYISKCEIGERRVDVIELIDIAEALNFDPCDIVTKLKKMKK